jgi:serine protease SohB
MEYLWELALFAGKVLLFTMGVVTVLIVLANLIARLRPPREELQLENVNDRFDAYGEAIQEVTMTHKEIKAERKAKAKREKAERKRGEAPRKPKIFVLNFDGDIRATEADVLKNEITAILAGAKPGDEVVVKIESTGGMVHGYGLAAAQLMRLKEAGVKLTACVDKVAASGGYMLACTADHLIAAPFAIIGSIGVVAQVPNFNRVLKKFDIDYEELTAGEFKRTVSLLGEITPKGRQKFVEQLEDTHLLFKEFVRQHRPKLNVEAVATGEYWFGQRAIDLGLVDALMSSDDYLYKQRDRALILELKLHERKSLGEKIAENFSQGFSHAIEGVVWNSLKKINDEHLA